METTEEWENQIDQNKDGDLKFPVKILDAEDLKDLGQIEASVTTSPPAVRKTEVREINLGNSSKKKGSKKRLF